MIASGRLDGPVFLEDAVDVVDMMVQVGRMPAASKWVTAASKAGESEFLGGII